MLYNNPVAYGTDFLPEQIRELASEHENFEAVKESSTDVRRITWIRELVGDRLAVFVGVDDAIVEGIAVGAVGWIAGLVNALPRESVELFNYAMNGQREQAIALYNSLRASPANSITLNQLMLMYAGMNEYSQAISAANEFPEALNASEQCMSTLGRVYLASEQRKEAIHWFEQALARNSSLGEAHYYKAVAHLTNTPPDYGAAVAAARQARNANFPNADALLREAEAKNRGE